MLEYRQRAGVFLCVSIFGSSYLLSMLQSLVWCSVWDKDAEVIDGVGASENGGLHC